MRTYKQPTLIWVGSVTTVAVAVTAWSIVADIAAWNVPARAFLMLALLAACAAVAHAYPIRSATDAATYSLTNVFIVAGASVLPASLITPLVFAALLPDSWRQRHRPGALLRLAFNISQASLAAHVAGVWVRTVSGDRMGDVQNLEHIIGLAGAPVLFTLAQALLVGVAIALQSGIPLHRVDTLAPTSLLGDGFVALQGTVVAGLWIAAPALLFFLPPLFLMAHRLTRTAHLAQVAQIDVKTGLHNSRHFEHALKDELAHSVRLKRPVSLVFIDLDHFKRVNDTYGHAAGDFVLSEMARVLQGLVRKEDTLARFGGEEFVVMLPGTDLEEAAYLAERLRSAVEEHEFALEDGRVIRCTASLGVATCPQHGTDMNRLIQEADAAMYRAKRTRNAVARAQGLHVLPRLDAGPASPAEPVTPQRRKEDARQAAQGAPHAPRAGVAILWTTVALGTAAAAVALVQTAQAQVWHVLVPFLVMAALAEVLKVQVYEASRERLTLSFTIAVTLASLTIAPVVAPLVSLAAAGMHLLLARKRQAPSKLLFNLANPTLAAASAEVVYRLLVPAAPGITPWFMAAALAAVLAFHTTNVGIISAMISIHTRQSFAKVVRQGAWFWPTHVLMGLTGAFLGGAYPQLGGFGIVMFTVPVLILRFTLTIYARQAQRTIQTLESAKAEVEAAHEEKETMLRKLIETVALIIDARDNSVSGHSRRVAKYSVAIGRELGMSPEDLASVHTAGLFHDLGKVGIPELLLHKPARLTDEEYVVVKQHAEIGERILSEVPQLVDISKMVGEHHERYDGGGYPKRLKADQISLGGRILMVADALETMLADRPYKRARPLEEALDELDRCAGTHFDPAIVGAVHRCVARHGGEFFTEAVDLPETRRPASQAAERILDQVFTDPAAPASPAAPAAPDARAA